MSAGEKQPISERVLGRPTLLAAAVSAALCGSVPFTADAAGLGRLTVQSGLGQPLQAEVEITALGQEEIGSLSARLASPEAFRQAGLEYNPALSGLRFAIERRPNGGAVVRVTSSQPVNEPFVDLLVELNWDSGRFVREYTFLLDPPELRMGRDTQVAGGRGSAVSAPAAAQPAAAAASPVGIAPVATAPAVSRVPATAAPAASPAASGISAAAGSEGGAPTTVRVRAGDTAAKIAARVKPAYVTVEQAVMAIYQANPRAFFGTVHQLFAGAELTIPDGETMNAVDAAAARREIRAQLAEFNAYRARLASAARTVEPGRAGQTAEGSVAPKAEEAGPPVASGDQLKLSRPGAVPEGATAGSATGTASAAASSDERQVAHDAALREQQERVAALERNVADLQRLVELKNRQLAELQAQVEAARAAGATATGTVGAGVAAVDTAAGAPAPSAPVAASASESGASASASAASPAGEDASPVPTTPASSGIASTAASAAGTSGLDEMASAPESATASVVASGLDDTPPATAGEPVAGASAADAGSGAAEAASFPASSETAPTTAMPAADAASSEASPATSASADSAEGAQPEAPAPAAAAQPVPPPAPEPTVLEALMDNPLALPALVAIALGLGAYGVYTVRRRRKATEFEDSLSSADAFTANSLFGSTGGQSVDTHASLFATSANSGVDVHSTEVDPIAEAEVYIAYGREAQAEEILKEALKRQPERQAIRLKLLEIHAARKDPIAFGALAQEMYDQTGGVNEEWAKVVTLGLAIDPANPLYTGQGEDAVAPTAQEADAAAPSGAPDEPPAIADLDEEAAAAAAMVGAPPRDAESASRAAVGPFAETLPMDGAETSTEANADDEIPALDFDLDLDTTVGRAGSQLAAREAADDAAEAAGSELERAIDGRFELPSLELDGAAAQSESRATDASDAAPAAEEKPAVADLGDFKIDLPSLEDIDARDERAADDEAGGDERPAVDLAELENSPGLGNLDLSSVNLDLSDGDVGLAAADTAVVPQVESSRWQEMATKLDLASAYEEIGDKEGARELLQEVLEGGDAAQQQKARAMLAKIG